MYSLISTIAKPFNSDGRWMSIDIANVSINLLFSTYSKILVNLSNPFISGLVCLDLEVIRNIYGGESITFNEFLIQNADLNLDTFTPVPVLSQKIAKYADAFHAGYKVQPIHPNAASDAQFPPEDKIDLLVTRPNTDYNLFYKNCLVNVNGFYHLTDTDKNGIYVKGGMKSCMLSGEASMGLYSFREVSEFKLIPILKNMIYKQNDRQLYKDKCFINLGEDVSTKTVMLVIGGYLHVLDTRTFSRVSESCFAIDIANLPLLERYYESNRYIDLSSLNLEKTNRNLTQVSISNFFSDETIISYLTISQSFFIILDKADIFINKLPIRKTKMPDMYISYTKPICPIIVGAGKTANHWSVVEDCQYSITCTDTGNSNRLLNTVDALTVNSVSDSRIPENPVNHSDAFFLEIGCDF